MLFKVLLYGKYLRSPVFSLIKHNSVQQRALEANVSCLLALNVYHLENILGSILTANSLSPTVRAQSLAAGLPGAKVATNTPLSSPMPLSVGS